jgi:hypothetical protein
MPWIIDNVSFLQNNKRSLFREQLKWCYIQHVRLVCEKTVHSPLVDTSLYSLHLTAETKCSDFNLPMKLFDKMNRK